MIDKTNRRGIPMEIRQLQTFLAIVKHMNFTKAANDLGYAQSTVTTQIKNLEDFLDTKLFERIGKSIFLTEMGEALVPLANQMVELYSQTQTIFKKSDKVEGLIRIATPESLCIKWFPKVFQKLGEMYKDVELDLQIFEGQEYEQMLKDNKADIAFVIYHEYDLKEDFLVFDTRKVDMHLIAGKTHHLANRKNRHKAALNKERVILTQERCSYRNEILTTFQSANVHPQEILSISNIQVIKELLQSGYGIGYLPVFAIHDELSNNQLVSLNDIFDDTPFYMSILIHKEKWRSPALKAFLEVLEMVEL
jgi:DNA-binding transcriptional LysR family regulator